MNNLTKINIDNCNFTFLLSFDTTIFENNLENIFEILTFKKENENFIYIISSMDESSILDWDINFLYRLKYITLIVFNNNSYSSNAYNISLTPPDIQNLLQGNIVSYEYGEIKMHFLKEADHYVVCEENNKKRKKDIDSFVMNYGVKNENKYLSGLEMTIDKSKLNNFLMLFDIWN